MARLELRLRTGLRDFAVDVDLTVDAAETLALAGPSGAGKTTVLRCVAGLHSPEDGRIALGRDIWLDSGAGVDLEPDRRSVGLVPQNLALFPHLSVRDNVGFGGHEQAAELMARLRIEHLADELPGRLSGGERQRVALARALARAPSVLLLDEPLAALDPHLRAHVRDDLRAHLKAVALPTLLVTHDFSDAYPLADRIAVLDRGQVRQIGTPRELLEAPSDEFVAAFTAVMRDSRSWTS